MRNVIDYKIAEGNSFHGVAALDYKVNILIKEGYEPLGGVSVLNVGNLFQAMVKYEEVDFEERIE